MSQGDPLWYKDAVIYQLHVRCFKDASGDGIGDFAGLLQQLDYIQQLGVTTIWLLPFYPSPLKDDGYDIADYRDVHGDYGSLEDFRRFVEEAHKRGLKVITELVINHTSDQHPWFQAARRADASAAQRDFYVWSDDDQKFSETRIIFTDTEASNWAWDNEAQAYYWHRFFSHQPDLNHNNPDVVQAVIEVMHFWLEMGVDGLRLDAIPYLCVREGTNNENLPETHQVIRRLRAAMDQRFPHAMLLAEANQWPEDSREYFGDGDECHMSFHFPLMPRIYMALAQEDRYPITEIMRQTPKIPEGCQWAIFLRNHDELTLEMVTDTERDYMYSVYADDPRMRCNVGIRRRLAPLMANDHAKIKLLNSILLSMPGTPIIYYGDEIGMGDNIYLGDRNGVRTPMQWSMDRNGGFSQADPARLYLPPIMDPLYGYQAVNVEAQQRDATSLLNWMRRLIAVRQAHSAFARGEQHFFFPGNRKVLAYTRSDHTQTVLCVANLSQYAQAVELDLAAYRGRVPVELLGRTPFPPVGDLPYLLTLPAHAFYWFLLAEEHDAPHWHREQPQAQPDMPYLVITGAGWDWLLDGMQREALEQHVLPAYLPARRWFASDHEDVRSMKLEPVGGLGDDDRWLLTQVRVDLADGRTHRYFLPLAVGWDDGEGNPREQLGGLVLSRVRRGGRTGVLFDGLHDEALVRTLSEFALCGGKRRYGYGTLQSHPVDNGDYAPPTGGPVRWIDGSSNTTCQVGDDLLLKVYRHLQAGEHPEIELSQELTSRKLSSVPPLRSHLEVEQTHGTYVLASLSNFIQCQEDGWHYTLDHLDRFLDTCVSAPPKDATTMEDLAGFWSLLSEMHVLGERLAEFHATLAESGDALGLQPVDADERGAWVDAVAAELDTVLQLLDGQHYGAQHIADLASQTVQHGPQLHAMLDSVRARIEGIPINKSRIHGDFHLSHVLVREQDFVFVDFEGDARLPLGCRRDKQSPLRDLAGLLRSISYASLTALRSFAELRTLDLAAILPWARRWESLVSDAVRAGYHSVTINSATGLIDRRAITPLLSLFTLEKGLQDVRDELALRPDWVDIPLSGLLALSPPDTTDS